MPKPNFLIVGQPKSGTTALHNILSQHPSVFMSTWKEPHYFASDLFRSEHPPYFEAANDEQYVRIFDSVGQESVVGESSTSYLYSVVAARNIFSYNPDARCLAIFRDPIHYLHSIHYQLAKHPNSPYEDEINFSTALSLEHERRQGRHIPSGCIVPRLILYRERVKYCEQIDRYLMLFPRDQIKICIYDDFKHEPYIFLYDLCHWLNIDKSFNFQIQTVNTTRGVRSRYLRDIMPVAAKGTGLWRIPHSITKAITPRAYRTKVKEWMLRHVAFGRKRRISPELVRTLKVEFRPEVDRLSKLIDRDLVDLWGYDKI